VPYVMPLADYSDGSLKLSVDSVKIRALRLNHLEDKTREKSMSDEQRYLPSQ